MDKKNVKQNDETNQIEMIQNGEELSEDLLEQIQGGGDNSASGGCCGINFACYKKGATGPSVPIQQDNNEAQLRVQ